MSKIQKVFALQTFTIFPSFFTTHPPIIVNVKCEPPFTSSFKSQSGFCFCHIFLTVYFEIKVKDKYQHRGLWIGAIINLRLWFQNKKLKKYYSTFDICTKLFLVSSFVHIVLCEPKQLTYRSWIIAWKLLEMRLSLTNFLVTIIFTTCSEAGRVLFYSPVSSKSYRILYNPILEELQK